MDRLAMLVRPLSGIRGFGRLCRKINRGALRFGVSPNQTAHMRDGTRIRVDLRSHTEWYSFYSGSYDDHIISIISNLMSQNEGDFLDVGANIGMYSVRVVASLKGERRAVCFEPMPNNASRIRENAKLNSLSDRIDVYEMALSDHTGEAELVLREDFTSGSSTGNASIAISDDADGQFHKIVVPICRFDDILTARIPRPMPVIKVDIEGHEACFFAGATKFLNRSRPIIFSEFNNWFYLKKGTNISDDFLAVIPNGYHVAVLRAVGSRVFLEDLEMTDLAKIKNIENCVLYPEERAEELRSVVAHTN